MTNLGNVFNEKAMNLLFDKIRAYEQETSIIITKITFQTVVYSPVGTLLNATITFER